MGVEAAKVEAMVARARPTAPPGVEVHAWLETTVRWFLVCATQWRRDAMGGIAGLDYAGAEAAARLSGLRPSPEDFDGLRVMEAEAMRAMREDRR